MWAESPQVRDPGKTPVSSSTHFEPNSELFGLEGGEAQRIGLLLYHLRSKLEHQADPVGRASHPCHKRGQLLVPSPGRTETGDGLPLAAFADSA